MQVKFKVKEKGEQPKLFTQFPHLLECFTKHPLEKHPKNAFLVNTPSGTRTLDTLIRLVGLPCLFLAYIAVATLAVPDLKGVPVRGCTL